MQQATRQATSTPASTGLVGDQATHETLSGRDRWSVTPLTRGQLLTDLNTPNQQLEVRGSCYGFSENACQFITAGQNTIRIVNLCRRTPQLWTTFTIPGPPAIAVGIDDKVEYIAVARAVEGLAFFQIKGQTQTRQYTRHCFTISQQELGEPVTAISFSPADDFIRVTLKSGRKLQSKWSDRYTPRPHTAPNDEVGIRV